MKRDLRSLLPALLLAAGCLGATAVAVWSSRSLVLALAGPVVLAATIIAAGAVRRRLLSRPQSYVADAIMAGAVVASGALVAVVEPSSVILMMPILSACAAMTLLPKRRCAAA
jgi:hypothetical protein